MTSKSRHPNRFKAPSGAFFYGIFRERNLSAETLGNKKDRPGGGPKTTSQTAKFHPNCSCELLFRMPRVEALDQRLIQMLPRSFRIETFARRFLSRGHPTPSSAPEGAANKNKLTHYPDVNRVSYSPVFTGYSQMWICSTAGRARPRSCILTFCRRPPANHWPLFPPSPFARH